METKNEQRLLEIIDQYFLCKNQFRLMTISSGHLDYDSPFYQFYRDVEVTLQKLDKDEQLIIRNEYFYSFHPGWWKPLYEMGMYFRTKKRAITKFVRLFHEIH